MGLAKTIWDSPADFLRLHEGDRSVVFFCPEMLQRSARRFLRGFPGLVTYAVKSNPDEMVISNLAAAGVKGFDVASPHEMALVARNAPGAVMHYNNPVRSQNEIRVARGRGVRSFAVDSVTELDKLLRLLPAAGTEVSIRFKLPVTGAAYDFGSKFGVDPDRAVTLLRQVDKAGFMPSLTFHPGTQCVSPDAWVSYVATAAEIARASGVRLSRLNVGGGFPARRLRDETHCLDTIFSAIAEAAERSFGARRPALLCEPGRALVAESFSLAARVKAIRDGRDVFLNDGVYGMLAELPLMGLSDRVDVIGADGTPRSGAPVARTVFGPTCDSVDRLPGALKLPADMSEGDFVVFHGLGAYSTATTTRFNGYGAVDVVTVRSLQP